ncbi:unnamed protein product [Bemisia tabaci]|uniref:WAP domain-containing protein n=1 Tax=Bemisia tabaci TaxID=7038 RepID=A0A9P0A8K8_BEMTA|nr:unnamed protein product [Bemisia tabaci]
MRVSLVVFCLCVAMRITSTTGRLTLRRGCPVMQDSNQCTNECGYRKQCSNDQLCCPTSCGSVCIQEPVMYARPKKYRRRLRKNRKKGGTSQPDEPISPPDPADDVEK